eukprot:5281726-Pleurochrysis_carterae.AAC.1
MRAGRTRQKSARPMPCTHPLCRSSTTPRRSPPSTPSQMALQTHPCLRPRALRANAPLSRLRQERAVYRKTLCPQRQAPCLPASRRLQLPPSRPPSSCPLARAHAPPPPSGESTSQASSATGCELCSRR